MRTFFMETDRLGFSIWSEADKDLALSLWGDEKVTQFISATGTFTGAQIAERLTVEISNQSQYGVQYWPVFEKATGAFIGCCGLRPYQDKGYELGFHLLSGHWGKGYATEAAKAAIGYAYNTKHAEGVFAGCHPENTASARVLQKLGFLYLEKTFYPPTGLMHPFFLHVPH